MKTHARVVIIGGGVVGVATAYALAKKGWSDVVLIERHELTSGSTWHAAGLLPLFNMSYSSGKIHQYSVDLYEKLEAETGQHVGLRQVSNIRMAQTKDRWDEFMYYAGVAETIGVDVNILTPEQVKEIWPLCNTEGIIGAIQHPRDGYIQPADVTQAMAIGARNGGVEINRNTCVTAIEQKPNDEWLVKTDKGDVTCEHLVSATGNFVRQTGAMLGLDIPVIPVQHQYIVTEPHPEIIARHERGLPEMGVLRDADASWYMREEAGGLLLGPYEKGAPVCYVDGPEPDAEYELFQEDLERLEPYIEACFYRVPAFGEVGIKKVYNGAICYTPDGSPIVGPAWGKRNLWLNEGHSFGITAAGGAGWQIAEWMVEGEPSIDMMGVDPRRFGPYASRGYLKEKNEEAYRNVFTLHFPDEERSTARPLKTAPCYDRMKALGAVFGSVYGWERPNWFAPEGYGFDEDEIERPTGPALLLNRNYAPPAPGEKVKELWSFRRSNYFEFVGQEVKNVHENAGLLDMTAFAKYMVTGADAEKWLDSILANRIPKAVGRIGLCHLLTPQGGVRSEFTVYKMAEGKYYLVGPGAFERHDWDTLNKHLDPGLDVRLDLITGQKGVLVLAGPRSREILQKLTDTDLSNDNFKWLTGKFINVNHASAHALRVNFVG
ncbi:MAG TPA: FAD-dependent oxidoreductase, partial [Rhizobiales bacterium]|nr:FAD-dependent oxidoreductase [Hyphomicrobiales bacterium]